MKEYYEILDIPFTATPEEIKAQYRQLVRIYHPDRFRNQDDKAFAEEKLKQINIAFQVLSGHSIHREPFEARVAPQPVAYPPELNLGMVTVGQRVKRSLQIGNSGGPADSVQIVYGADKSWFQLLNGQRVYPNQPFPLNFEVVIDTRRLAPNRQYREWVDIVLDGIPVRVYAQLQTVAPRRTLPRPARLAWAAAALLMVVAIFLAIPLLGGTLPNFPIASSLLSARPAYELRPEEMLFSVVEDGQSALYVGLDADSAPRRLGLDGSQAVGTQIGQRIAYLNTVGATQQIFLFELASGETKQITEDSATKTMLAWSPDGVRLGYLVNDGDARQLAIYDTRTAREHLLPGEFTAGVENFAWSPDGQTLLFDLPQGAERRVYRVGVNGDELQQLTHFDSWAGAWSADGLQILVGAKQGLYVLSSGGQKVQQLTTVTPLSFSWSADGQWIAYTTATPVAPDAGKSEDGRQLWLIGRNGGEPQLIATNPLSHQWSPTTTTLGYVTGNAASTDPLLYLWTTTPATKPVLVAEVNDAFFAWPR
jgi:hypothetical protein